MAPLYAIIDFILFVAVFLTISALLVWLFSNPRVQSKLQTLQEAWIAFKNRSWNWATAWLYRRDWTKRRAKSILRTVGYMILILSVIVVLALVVNYRSQVWAYLLAFPLMWVDSLEAFASVVGLNGPELATIASADLIVVIATAILNFIVIRTIRKDRPHPAANLLMYHNNKPISEGDLNWGTVQNFRLRVSNEEGDDVAKDCRVTAVFTGIVKEDIIDDRFNPQARYGPNRFSPTLRIALRWSDGFAHHTFVSGDEGYDISLEVVRLVPAKDRIPSHFEVCSPGPSISEKRFAVCLNLKRYYGEIRIYPSSGKYKRFRFAIEPRRELKPTNEIEEYWSLICGEPTSMVIGS